MNGRSRQDFIDCAANGLRIYQSLPLPQGKEEGSHDLYHCYLFDFDYTLVDSTAGIVGCFQRVLRDMGRPAIEPLAIQRTIGLPMTEAVGKLLGTEDAAAIAAFIRHYQPYADRYMTPGTHFYPDALTTLSQLRSQSAKIAIISSKTSRRIQEKFDRDGVSQLIDFIIGCQEVASLKPSPEGIEMALSRLDLPPQAALYIGDSFIDAQAAQAAGVDFFGVTTGTTTPKELARYPHIAIAPALADILTLP